MNGQVSFVRRHGVVVFSALTIGLSFAATLLPLAVEAVMLVIAVLPACVALALTAISDGRSGVWQLLVGGGRWRLRPLWIMAGIALGLGLRLGVGVAALALGWLDSLQLRGWAAPQFAFFALLVLLAAAPEELGWRGYALPKLLERRSALTAGLLVGVPWSCVHLALGLPGMAYAAQPLVPLVVSVVALSLIAAWLYVVSGANLLVTTVFHAAQSFFVVINDAIAPSRQLWLMAAVYLGAALLLAVLWRQFTRSPAQRVAESLRRVARTPFLPGIDD